jgi:phage tail-like protein
MAGTSTDPTKNYPLPKFHFQVTWQVANGGPQGSMAFTEVSGLDFETEVIEFRTGDSPHYNKTKQPGLTKYGNITLKRGTFKGDLDFYNYWLDTYYFQGVTVNFRTTVKIDLLDETHQPVFSWSLANAWPTKITSTDLKADANEVAIESMELVHEGLTLIPS